MDHAASVTCAGFYVTGTDTGVGKTCVTLALLAALQLSGKSAVGFKPVASGCIRDGEAWHNADALDLQRASVPTPAYALVNPMALPDATAPQIAAAAAGITVSLPPLVAAFSQLALLADSVVVEGVGGWLAPLADDLEQAQLAAALGLPVIMVVGIKLGCLSHARLTERAILQDGFPLAGWIGSSVDPHLDFAEPYEDLLRRYLSSPCLGVLPHQAATHDARAWAVLLRVPGIAADTPGRM